ncbi:MAG TPA: hypothetical protein VJC18_05935, partial [bacterium]|nr:hypothetical protein [bacterium]
NSAYEEKRCDADVSGASVPAFWGHFTSYNLVEKGLLGEQGYDVLGMSIPYSINDDTIPLIWSVGKIRLKFEDLDPGDDKDESVIQVTREKIGDVWSNKVNIINDAIKNYSQDIVSGNQLSTLFDASKMSAKTIQIESFDNCKSYYQNQHPGYFVPFGCDDEHNKNYPFVLELNSVAGQRVYSDMTASGQNSSFLGIIWWGVMETFKKMVGCMDEELVNPMISSQYKYPAWVWAGSTFSTDFEWEDFDFGANIENADLNIFDGGLTVRLPLSLGVDGVPLTKRIGWKGLASSLPVIKQTGQSTVSTYNQANISGHLRRSSKNKGLDDYPLVSATPQQSAFLGLSLNLEEIFNSAAYLIFKKGPMSLLDTFGIEDIEANNNWSVGVDKVILARFDICDLAGLIPSELPPSLFFATIQSSFSESTLHLDVILDKDYPVTLSLNPVEGLDNATEVQLGVTNLQIGVKELMAHKNEAGETEANVYEDPASQPELLRFRLDGVIRARLVYHKTQRQIHVYIPGYAEQNIHASVPSGHGGATYDDVNVVTDVLNGVVKALFKKMQKDINEDITYDDQDKATINVADANPTIIISLKGGDSANAGSLSLSNIDDFEIELKMDAAENATCGDDVAYYDGEQPETALPGKAIKPGSQPGMLGSDQPWKQKD